LETTSWKRSIRTYRRWLACVVAFMLFPGAPEALTDVGHLIVDGHSVHDVVHADDHPPGDEHGCSGLVHVCRCCTSPPALAGASLSLLPAPTRVTLVRVVRPARGAPREAHSEPPFRPPTA